MSETEESPVEGDEGEAIEEQPAAGESPEGDEPNELQQAIQRAGQTHNILSDTKTWALETANEIERQAQESDDEESVAQLMQHADYIRSVYRRIEHGDSNVARVTGDF